MAHHRQKYNSGPLALQHGHAKRPISAARFSFANVTKCALESVAADRQTCSSEGGCRSIESDEAAGDRAFFPAPKEALHTRSGASLRIDAMRRWGFRATRHRVTSGPRGCDNRGPASGASDFAAGSAERRRRGAPGALSAPRCSRRSGRPDTLTRLARGRRGLPWPSAHQHSKGRWRRADGRRCAPSRPQRRAGGNLRDGAAGGRRGDGGAAVERAPGQNAPARPLHFARHLHNAKSGAHLCSTCPSDAAPPQRPECRICAAEPPRRWMRP